MNDNPQGQTSATAQKRFERFVKSFELTAKNQASLAEAIGDLAGIVDDEKTGLISVLATLIDEIRGLRMDLRQAAKVGGLGGILDMLQGGR